MVTISVNHDSVSFVVAVTHGPLAVSVSVQLPHPRRHAVSQGRNDVIVGVVGQFVFGPGIVVVLEVADQKGAN
jgi:hypothetical protein